MKLAIIADIHSNLAALTEVLKDITAEGVDQIISLGDIIGYGPDPREVLEQVHTHDMLSVLGNHEYALQYKRYLQQLNPDPQASLKRNLTQIDQAEQEYLKQLPPMLSLHNVRFVHGCPPKSPTAYLMEPSEALLTKIFASFPEQIAFYGHTHCYALFDSDEGLVGCREFAPGSHPLDRNRRYIVNPGSVGQPRDFMSTDAKYAILDLSSFTLTLRSIPYDINKTAAALRRLGYPDFNAERLFYSFVK